MDNRRGRDSGDGVTGEQLMELGENEENDGQLVSATQDEQP
jgi:hypothetical protein